MLIWQFNYYSLLTQEIKTVEILEDDQELDLFSQINGNKDDNIKGPKEIE